MRVEPLPETNAALAELSALGDTDLASDLRGLIEQARSVVPELVGVSIAALQEGLTFTFVASHADIAVLDALRYLDGGPCMRAAKQNHVVSVQRAHVLDEQGWVTFARATAAASITSTLSLPITSHGSVTGSVNLYAMHPRAFDGHHQALALIFGAWAGGAVTNADLSFSTRDLAKNAPATLQAQSRMANAIGVIAERHGVDVNDAQRRLHTAADLAGVPPEVIAQAVLDTTISAHRP